MSSSGCVLIQSYISLSLRFNTIAVPQFLALYTLYKYIQVQYAWIGPSGYKGSLQVDYKLRDNCPVRKVYKLLHRCIIQLSIWIFNGSWAVIPEQRPRWAHNKYNEESHNLQHSRTSADSNNGNSSRGRLSSNITNRCAARWLILTKHQDISILNAATNIHRRVSNIQNMKTQVPSIHGLDGE